ncbi:hypothetical protein ACHQM5_018611 [Ranunculus cassubicifolius]
MGKHPRDFITSLSTPTTQNLLLKDLIDTCVSPPTNRKIINDLVLIVRLAFACVQSNPHHRPTMKQVSQNLSTGEEWLLPHFEDITVQQLLSREM